MAVVASCFEKHKVSDTGAVSFCTWNFMYALTMRHVMEAMAGELVPRDGRVLLELLRDRCGGSP